MNDGLSTTIDSLSASPLDALAREANALEAEPDSSMNDGLSTTIDSLSASPLDTLAREANALEAEPDSSTNEKPLVLPDSTR